MTTYPIFVGPEKQQVISEPDDTIFAWCQVSPMMSLIPSKDDDFLIVSVKATLVENSLNDIKLKNPNQVAINWINPSSGMSKYEIIPVSSIRFDHTIDPDKFIKHHLGG